MWNLSIYIVCIYLLTFVRSDCLITYPRERKLMPSYRRLGGLKIPYNNLQPIIVRENEIIDVSCLTKIKTFYDGYDWNDYYKKYNSAHRIENVTFTQLVCRDGKIKLHEDGHVITTEELSCEPIKWSMYYSQTKNVCVLGKSYLLGTSLGDEFLVLAALCYDDRKYAINTLKYYLGPDSVKDDHNERPDWDLGFPSIQHSETFLSNIFHMSHINNGFLSLAIDRKTLHNPWLHMAHYKYHSLVQGKLYREYFREYNGFLEIPWWHNLRHGNWKRFTQALDQQATVTSFHIHTGTSGIVEVPFYEGHCTETKHLHWMVQGVNVTVPAYIWSYIQPRHNNTAGFVVVGYNSPYFEFFAERDLVFCKDICDTIDWLSQIRYSFKYTNAGRVFCCSPKEIWEKNLLQGFPDAPSTKQPKTTARTTTPTPRYSHENTDYEGITESNEVD